MRAAALALLAASIAFNHATALQLPDFQPFTSAISHVFDSLIPESLQNITAHDVLKRASSGCPNDFNSCANAGAANLCCAQGSVCSADYAGHVACCPSGAACTGVVASTITAGTVNAAGGIATASATGAGGSVAATTTFQPASSQTTGAGSTTTGGSTEQTNSGFIVAGGTTIATPAGAVRAMEIVSLFPAADPTRCIPLTFSIKPLVAKVLIRVLEYLPL